jgi:GDP-4-dehydro-6-deoxy-D-mannose reductase
MLQACRNFTPDARFLNVGSAGAYGPPVSVPVTEEHPLNPEEPYSISKAAADQYCAFAHCAQGIDTIRTRPFNHSGPGQSDRFVLPAFAKQVAEIEAGQRPPQLQVGDVNTARDFLHVADVVRAYELAALKGKSGEAYNICFGRSFKIKEALHLLLDLSEVDIDVVIEEDRLRPVDIQNVYGSHDKLTDHTGWRPEIPLKTLLGELLDDCRKQVGG